MFAYNQNVIAIPPGETIREQLKSRGMSQKEFAERMGISEKHISNLINGKVELTSEMALKLESVLGVPAAFWNNLESRYREQLARIKKDKEIDQEIEMMKKIPYSKISGLGWLPKTSDKKEKISNLRSFFEVANLNLLNNLSIPGIAYRKTGANATSDYSLAAWAQKARLEARGVTVSPININKLEKSIPYIRSLTIQSPLIFCDQLKKTLSECGIVIIFLPHIGGSFLHGASFIDNNRIILGLTVRRKYADVFWFSLFHELYHIIAGHVFRENETTQQEEDQADTFAKDVLIDPNDYDDFIQLHEFSKTAIKTFAKKIGIDPGIVVGRLQKENIIRYNQLTDLKSRYEIE